MFHNVQKQAIENTHTHLAKLGPQLESWVSVQAMRIASAAAAAAAAKENELQEAALNEHHPSPRGGMPRPGGPHGAAPSMDEMRHRSQSYSGLASQVQRQTSLKRSGSLRRQILGGALASPSHQSALPSLSGERKTQDDFVRL